MHIKSEPIASDSLWLVFKLIEDHSCKYNDKKFGLFVRKLSFSWSKNGFFIFCNSGVINVWICCVESILPGPLIKKFCLVQIGLKRSKLSTSYFMRYNGYEFQTLSDALDLTVVVLIDLLAKLKLVTFWTQLLSTLTCKLYLALAKSELKLIQPYKYVGAKQFVSKQSNLELNTKFNCWKVQILC